MNAKRAAAKTKPVGTADGADQPIYLQIAGQLKRDITSGRYPVGSNLPPEVALCEQLGVSRFTMRAAIRVLTTAGLVTRRQRVGTVVIARPDDARYSQDVQTVSELFQYAQDTEMSLIYIGKIALGRAQAREFEAVAGEEWIYAIGLRQAGTIDAPRRGRGAAQTDALPLSSRPICITRLYLNPVLKGIEAKLRRRSGAVYALIEREYGLSLQRVEQELLAVVLDADDAANLQATPGAPALRIVRRYYSDSGQLLQVADNIHPSDRFTYRMQLTK